MSNGKAIEIRGLSKCYEIDQRKQQESYETVRGAIRQTLSNLWSGRTKTQKTEFWALRDVEFDIEKGDRLAIIGPNGAGKSTLLKILSRVTNPTAGEIKISGMLTSLLEVGTGFHPELTGRENIFLNGSILGMSRNDIARQMDEIIAFAGVESFIDVPLKRYSSGMAARLGFAVAAHLQSDIMIVDEVLAVGDAAFQKKCLGKMDEVSKTGGRTILFVSHNIHAVKQLCSRGLVLEKGKVRHIGDIHSSVEVYNKQINRSDSIEYKSKSDCIELIDIQTPGDVSFGDDWKFSFTFKSTKDFPDCYFDCGLYNREILPIVHVQGSAIHSSFDVPKGVFKITVTFQNVNLNIGEYLIGIYLASFSGETLLDALEIQAARVVNVPSYTGASALVAVKTDITVGT